jgi:hypothetical protein
MRIAHQLLAAAIVAASFHVHAADIELSHVTLSNVHGTHPAFELGAVNITDNGHIASLDFAGMASFMSIEQTGAENVGLYNDLQMLAIPAAGYAVRSLRIQAELDITATAPSADQFVGFSFYFESPSLLGNSYGLASDGLVLDWMLPMSDADWVDPSAPFNIHVNTALDLPWYSSWPVPAGTTSVSFRSIRLDIETVPLVSQVPEPASWAMLLAGLAGVGLAARRRHG